MLKRILIVLSLSCSLVYATDPPKPASAAAGKTPSEASVKQLLEVMQARKIVDTMMTQMDVIMKNAVKQVTQGRPIPANVQTEIDKQQSEITTMMREILEWSKLEPVYLRAYQKSFTQEEIEGIIAMYRSPAGQTILNKMPIVMQNTTNEMQQIMAPIMQRIQRMQQEVVAKIQAERGKKE